MKVAVIGFSNFFWPLSGRFKAVAKDHLKSLVRSSNCLVILDFFHFTPLVLIGKKIFFFLKLEARLEAVIFSYSLNVKLGSG